VGLGHGWGKVSTNSVAEMGLGIKYAGTGGGW